jgi:hypothetical protein
MARRDRRERLALDKAYDFYRRLSHSDSSVGLFKLANALKTVIYAIRSSGDGEFKLTTRLWQRIEQALFDKLLRTFPAYVAIFSRDGQMLNFGEDLPNDGKIVIHPQGLRRIDDFFSMPVSQLHPNTRMQLALIWNARRALTCSDDFGAVECTEVCVPPNFFVPGLEILEGEAISGKQLAYKQWWDLYWQSYCTADRKEKGLLTHRMSALEDVWGNLNY